MGQDIEDDIGVSETRQSMEGAEATVAMEGIEVRHTLHPMRHLHRNLLQGLSLAARQIWQLRGDLVHAVRLMLVLVVLCGGVFPLLLFAIGQAAFPFQANGSLLINPNGQVIGSSLIEQQFTRPEYFHGRPSAVNFNGAGSGASNLGPSNAQLTTNVQQYADKFRQENGLAPDTPLPADIVTASGSGLDPEISVAAAMLQVNRVAAARESLGGANTRVTAAALRSLIAQHIEGRDLGVLGEPRVNVLQLNLALDTAYGPPPANAATPAPSGTPVSTATP